MSHTQGWVGKRQLLSIKPVRLRVQGKTSSSKSEAAVTGRAGLFAMWTFSPISFSRQ